jgi:hypothetical protein
MRRKNGIPYIIDIEASGFGEESYQIEIGVILNDESKYCALIRPQPDWLYWDDEETKLDRHRASNDAWIIQETFRQTLKTASA